MSKRPDLAKRNETHGLSKNDQRLYRIWKGMNSRCNIESASGYKNYGARGIKVCESWKNYASFYEWALSNGYQPNLTIERKNVNDDYSPSNCEWVTKKQQANNKRNSLKLEVNGEILTLAEISERYEVNYGTLLSRYQNGELGSDLIRPVIIEGTSSKLTKSQEVEIMNLFKNGASVKDLISKYHVGKSTLYKIRKRIEVS